MDDLWFSAVRESNELEALLSTESRTRHKRPYRLALLATSPRIGGGS